MRVEGDEPSTKLVSIQIVYKQSTLTPYIIEYEKKYQFFKGHFFIFYKYNKIFLNIKILLQLFLFFFADPK